jgi:hypothetical protein
MDRKRKNILLKGGANGREENQRDYISPEEAIPHLDGEDAVLFNTVASTTGIININISSSSSSSTQNLIILRFKTTNRGIANDCIA